LRKSEVNDQNLRVIRDLNDHASERGQTLAQMALSWVLRDKRVTSALIGSSRPEQILENVKAAKKTDFTTEELVKLDKILAKANMPKSLWAKE
jgi:L-glyceraldehyde 3-phosphate reductase